MLATLDFIAIVLVLALCLFFLLSKRSLSRLNNALEKEASAQLFQPPFKCVLVHPTASACKSSCELQHKPLLLSESPSLPLAGCDVAVCHCSFVQREDRRTGVDRRENEAAEKRRIYDNKRMFKDRRRASIQAFLLPQPRSFG